MNSFENKVCETRGQVSKPGNCCTAVAALLMSIFIIGLSSAANSQDLSIATATPTPSGQEENPFAKLASHRKPIPLGLKIAIVLGAIVIASVPLWIAMRVWRSSNLFDRQYRFPQVETAALRLGANRSGGHMAVVTFRDRAGPPKERL